MHNFAKSLVPRSVKHFLPQTHKRVVVLGGGPTGLLCADRLRHQFEVTVVDSKQYFEYTPSILRAVVQPAHMSDITFDYRQVLEGQLGIEFVQGDAGKIDVAHGVSGLGAKTVTLKNTTGPSKLYFDYCVVAVGVGNGIWKPRTDPEAPTGPTSGPPPTSDERTLDGRRSTLQSLRQQIASSRGVLIIGAGLVGVELAAEVAHFFPQVKVTLVDGAPDVLPQLDQGAREYARTWLQQNNVKLKLGKPFVPAEVGADQMVIWCVGTQARSAGLFTDETVLRRPNGQIVVNRNMQVLRAPEGETAEPLGQGSVFAVGDACSIEGCPTAQMIFHGEEMAAVCVANIEAAQDVSSQFKQAARQIEPEQPFLCSTSLGPQDGMFSTQTELVATGSLAALQKQLIETTKVSALQGDIASSAIWYPVH